MNYHSQTNPANEFEYWSGGRPSRTYHDVSPSSLLLLDHTRFQHICNCIFWKPKFNEKTSHVLFCRPCWLEECIRKLSWWRSSSLNPCQSFWEWWDNAHLNDDVEAIVSVCELYSSRNLEIKGEDSECFILYVTWRGEMISVVNKNWYDVAQDLADLVVAVRSSDGIAGPQ